MPNGHEEADDIIVTQMLSSARQGYKIITLCMAIHDVFVIWVHFYKTLTITSELVMVPPSYKTWNAAIIGKTVRKHEDIVPHALSLQALTGCNTVSSIDGVGKAMGSKDSPKR